MPNVTAPTACAAAFVPEIWGVWATLLSTDDVVDYTAKQNWWARFEEVRERENFFHWELEFPEVFFGENRGFDVIVGNPPWDKVLPDRQEFYGRYDIFIRALSGNELDQRISELQQKSPALAGEFKAYESRVKTTMQMLRGGGDYPLSAGRTQAAHEDLSKYFADRSIQVVRPSGRVGLLLPSVFYNGDGCATLRKWLTEEAQILSVFGFENRQKLFPIDSRYKFACFVWSKERPVQRWFRAVFMRHDVQELLDENSVPMVTVTAEEIEKLSPESYALLEYRGPRDQEIVRKMYRNNLTLAEDGKESWGARFISWRAHEMIFNASEDKDLWTDPAEKKFFTPESVLGRKIEDPLELLRAMQAAGFSPVYEGKHVEQFVFGMKPIRWWMRREFAKKKYGKEPYSQPILAYRETGRNTDQRTLLLAGPAFSTGTRSEVWRNSHAPSRVRLEAQAKKRPTSTLHGVSLDQSRGSSWQCLTRRGACRASPTHWYRCFPAAG